MGRRDDPSPHLSVAASGLGFEHGTPEPEPGSHPMSRAIRVIRTYLVAALVAGGGTAALAGCGKPQEKPPPPETKPVPGEGAGGLNPDG
jgi:hypothetical protein